MAEIEAEKQILEFFNDRDEEGFMEYIMCNYRYILIKRISRILGKKYQSDIEDIIQEILIKLLISFRRKTTFHDHKRGKFITWILTLARNESVEYLRSSARRENSFALLSSFGGIDEDVLIEIGYDGLEDLFIEKELLQIGLKIISEDENRMVFYFYEQGLTIEEISKKLKIPKNTVKSRLRRLRQKMRRRIEFQYSKSQECPT